MDIKSSLQQLGLRERQISIYLALLQMGEAMVQDLSAKTKIKRTTVYSILDTLVQKGLATFIDKGFHRFYYAENPKKVLVYFKDQKENLVNQEKKFSEILPELAGLYNVNATKPKIRFYEGVEGLKQIYEETLLLKSNEEMLAYGQAELIHKILGDEWVENYLVRRHKARIFQRAIVEDSELGREHQKNDKEENRETILVPKEIFPFVNEINIFANKLSIVSFKEQMGVIIESADVAKTQRAIFELAWLGAKGLNK